MVEWYHRRREKTLNEWGTKLCMWDCVLYTLCMPCGAWLLRFDWGCLVG